MSRVEVVSFGFLHGDPPPAHVVIDLRTHFRDPHVRPELRYMTAEDVEVVRAVLGTSGIPAVVDGAVAMVHGYLAGPVAAPIVVAVGCAGGRHRAATVAARVHQLLRRSGVDASLSHRDLHQPVVNR